MKTWWHLRPDGSFTPPRRLFVTPERWDFGAAATWYGGDLAFGVRNIGGLCDFSRWAVDIGPLAVHGWWPR